MKANLKIPNQTNEVDDKTCGNCRVPDILQEHPCSHLDFVVDIIPELGGNNEVNIKILCAIKVAELKSVDNCNPDCRLFEKREVKI